MWIRGLGETHKTRYLSNSYRDIAASYIQLTCELAAE